MIAGRDMINDFHNIAYQDKQARCYRQLDFIRQLQASSLYFSLITYHGILSFGFVGFKLACNIIFPQTFSTLRGRASLTLTDVFVQPMHQYSGSNYVHNFPQHHFRGILGPLLFYTFQCRSNERHKRLHPLIIRSVHFHVVIGSKWRPWPYGIAPNR